MTKAVQHAKQIFNTDKSKSASRAEPCVGACNVLVKTVCPVADHNEKTATMEIPKTEARMSTAATSCKVLWICICSCMKSNK